ncbi:MAG: DNA/RNA non-specific endonuclease [Bacteroidia bacterium]|nr:DNA/RNA non-specific endonuclease [Bacteroidia bacterium]
MKNIILLISISLCIYPSFSQDLDSQIKEQEVELKRLFLQQKDVELKLEKLKLAKIRLNLEEIGLPALNEREEVIKHKAMYLVYDEEHEQAKWVAHIIRPEVVLGNVGRSNDFRKDPKINTGSAQEEDYFLKYLKPDSSYKYDGFGYDRGHLAPSADFRWSSIALSESYFYSNMSPQSPKFNRGKWAELESVIRSYIDRNPKTQLYVVTGPVLADDLPKVERSINKVSIPQKYYKVVLDYDKQKAIAFLLPNEECLAPVESYATSIDEVEQLTGIDFFPSLPDEMENVLEKSSSPKAWLPNSMQEDVLPIKASKLPPKSYNTIQARLFAGTGEKVRVCGTVVSTKLTSKGHTFLNLDKKFPNQIFTVSIWRDNASNFSYAPHIELKDKQVCFEGKVTLSQGTPTMEIRHEKVVELFQP